jgi:hypothetical protein
MPVYGKHKNGRAVGFKTASKLPPGFGPDNGFEEITEEEFDEILKETRAVKIDQFEEASAEAEAQLDKMLESVASSINKGKLTVDELKGLLYG